MTSSEFLKLAVLLIKWRANFALSRRFRDTIDEIVIKCLENISGIHEDRENEYGNDIPF